jgi:hypothetical protein
MAHEGARSGHLTRLAKGRHQGDRLGAAFGPSKDAATAKMPQALARPELSFYSVVTTITARKSQL